MAVLLASVERGIEFGEDRITLPANSVAILGPDGEDTAQALFRSSVEVLSIDDQIINPRDGRRAEPQAECNEGVQQEGSITRTEHLGENR